MPDQIPCHWCDKLFTPTDDGCLYALIQAGITICLDCCDKWEDKEIDLHMSRLHVYLDEQEDIKTANGTILPIKIVEWHRKLGIKGFRQVGTAIDSFGRKWTCKPEPMNVVGLRPTRG